MDEQFHRPYRGAMHPVPFDELAVAELLESVTRFDGHPPLSGHKLETMGGDHSKAGVWSDGSAVCVVAVAAFHESGDRWAVEIAVAPAHRDGRTEEAAIRAGTDLVPGAAAHTLWAFRADQIEAAERLGYREVRSVLRMGGSIPIQTGERVRRGAIVAMESEDVGEIIALNSRAFAGHPEQGAMTEEDFAPLLEQPGFDSAGVLVARRGERIAGFCITKRGGIEKGEIFVIAVDPMDQHSGIGRELIEAGFNVLREGGARTVNVWVDEANEAAIGLYASLGLVEDFRTRELALS